MTALLTLCVLILGLLTLAVLLLARKLRRLRRIVRRQGRHVWETHNLMRLFPNDVPLPLPGGWAAGTELLGELLRTVTARAPRIVVELGSGLSSLVLAAALRRNGTGQLISIDADEQYGRETRAQLRLHDLSAWAELRIAPLADIEFEGRRRRWYDTRVLQDLPRIDLLFIDGPPTGRRADARYPALPFFWERLNAGAVVLLDDADRRGERAIAREWQRRFPQARFERLRYEKGTLRITKPD